MISVPSRDLKLHLYPQVIGEAGTLQLVLDGHSLARYGDGEINLANGLNIPCQVNSGRLRQRMRGILKDSGECLVGIPNIHSDNLKTELWNRYAARTAPLLADRPYVSSFISRPDSAHWIDTPMYWEALESLWAGKDVTLVRSDSQKTLQPSDLSSARSVREVFGPRKNAFAEYDSLLEKIGTPALAILCLGPTATVLAVDLCARGVHAVDAGHIGVFLRKHHRGESMTLTPPEKMRDF